MRGLKPVVFAACLIPLGLLLWRGFTGDLTANPIEYITHRTGDWALRLLLVTLAITPLRRLTGWNAVIGVRRMLGLFAFFYGSLHFLTYVVLDHFFALESILEDLTDRRFVTAGFTGFVLMIPLALTSTQAMVRRLGGRRWQALHRLVYVSACAGVRALPVARQGGPAPAAAVRRGAGAAAGIPAVRSARTSCAIWRMKGVRYTTLMSIRLQVVMDEAEVGAYRRLAARDGLTLSEWVRQKLRHAGRREASGGVDRKLAAIRAAARNDFPTADIDQMLREIESGYRT